MNGLTTLKSWIGALTEVGLMLLALGITLALLAGPQVPFIGDVTKNIIELVSKLGSQGIVGLISLGVIVWLFSKRNIT
jgi:hypothetical protein